jgi:hypothetical protein
MDPVKGLSLGRIVVGLVSFFAPDLAARALLLSPKNNPQLPYMFRLFGAREVALGAATLMASGPSRTQLVAAGIAVDAADAATGVISASRSEVGKVTGYGFTAVAVGAVGAGVAALLLGRREPATTS